MRCCKASSLCVLGEEGAPDGREGGRGGLWLAVVVLLGLGRGDFDIVIANDLVCDPSSV